MGQYTLEEFGTGFGQFKATNKPLIYTYFKDSEIKISSINKTDFISLWAFQEKLNNLGHFYTTYNSIDDLKFKFGQQLDKLLASGALTHQIGNRVLAFWPADYYWYPGTVGDIRENRFLIKFDDGYQEWMRAEDVIFLQYRGGDYVECRWKGQNSYYPAHILDIDGENITVQYDDDFSREGGPSSGQTEQTNITLLRFTK